jgi:N-acetylmuramoyl-L-alanine amidase
MVHNMRRGIKTAFLLFMVMVNTVMCMGNTEEKVKKDITSFFENTDSLSVTNPLISDNKNVNKGRETICIDPGHQRKGNNAKEETAPGSGITKPKVSSGTAGTATKKDEYVLTLEVGLKLKKKLENEGYNVIMTRETHDVNISNKERSVMTNNAGCSLYIRIHADGSENRNASGISVLTSSSKNKYTQKVQASSDRFSRIILEETLKTTGAKSRGVSYRDDLTGTNWSTVTNTLIEMGFMSNPEEDRKLSTPEYQDKMVDGMVNGINRYLRENQ